MSEFVKVAEVSELPPGGRKTFTLDGLPVALFNVEGEYFCLGDVCTHDGGPLADGELSGYEIECPRHGALFDIRTGAALVFPATVPAPIYRVRVEGNDVLVSLE